MGRIQSDVGLITGMQIGKTIEALMKIAARPRDMLTERTNTLKKEQVAVTELSALLMAVRYLADNLGKADVFQKLKITSGNDAVLGATLTGKPGAGIYQFTPLRTAEYQQFFSSGVASDRDPLGGGTLTFRFGDNVRRSASLDLFGGGTGFVRGKIRITDRSGASAEIDLSAAQTLDDVLEAINASSAINVSAEVVGDRIRLSDRTGQTQSNLMVQEVGRGTTAASLGLAGIDVAAPLADGQDLLRLTEGTALGELNDGNGIVTSTVLPDIAYTLSDGTTGQIDLSPVPSGGGTAQRERTLGQILSVINAAQPGKLKAEIAPDGDRLIVTDLTAGSGAFSLESLYDSTALADLGLSGAAAGGVITGRRLLGGLQTVLLSSLGGGKGLGPLGALQMTDRSGASATVNLAAAETLDDVIAAINASGIGITARVNDARNGILLADTTGAPSGSLIVADGDATQTATKLKIAVNADRASVNSGDLHLKVISHNTKLDALNGGAGVARANLKIVNSRGQSGWVNLADSEIQTVGDVIRAINRLYLNVRAELNATGDGIALVDSSQGSGRLHVESSGSTAAADLHLDAAAVDTTVDGSPVQLLDGTTTETIQLGADDSLADLRSKIAATGAGVSAQILVDGSSRPYHLSLMSPHAGRAGQLVVDASGLDLPLTETSRGRDALLLVGAPGTGASQVLLASSTNEFTNALPGATLQIKQPSDTPVTVRVDTTDSDVVANVKTLVDNYNKFRKKLQDDTVYDVQTNKGSVLTGDAAALRLDTELSYLLSSRFVGAGKVQTLAELGINLKDNGTLELDEAKLKARFAADPQAVQDFFTKKTTGFSAKLAQLIDRLSGRDVSLLDQRLKTLSLKIEESQARIDFLDKRLEVEQERLYMEFYRMELAVSKLQTQLTALEAFNPLEPWTSTSTSSS